MGDDFKKNSAFPEESKQGFTGREFYRYFVLIWTKQRLIWFNLQRDGTRNGLSNIKETFAENLQLKILVLCSKVRLLSQVHMMAGQNKCKEKEHDVPDPNQNVETLNSSLHNLKIYSPKG